MMIGNKLRLLRTKADMTQDQFAKFLGMSRATYNPLEMNRQIPTQKVVERIEEKLGIKLDDPRIEQFVIIELPKDLAVAA
jgi:transcriptional regulator with XRE-family HTH domain